jgi:hypothetical protein
MRKVLTLFLLFSVTVCLALSCSDSSDNIENSSPDQDTIGPHVVFAYPGGEGSLGQCETEWATPVLVAFSEPIMDASVSSGTFDVDNGKEGRIEVCGNVIVFHPETAFDNLVLVEVNVSGEISDTAGNSMGDDYIFSFSTRGEP